MFDGDEEAYLVQVVSGNVEDHGFVVHWVFLVSFHGGLLLLDLSAGIDKAHFDVGIWREARDIRHRLDSRIYLFSVFHYGAMAYVFGIVKLTNR